MVNIQYVFTESKGKYNGLLITNVELVVHYNILMLDHVLDKKQLVLNTRSLFNSILQCWSNGNCGVSL